MKGNFGQGQLKWVEYAHQRQVELDRTVKINMRKVDDVITYNVWGNEHDMFLDLFVDDYKMQVKNSCTRADCPKKERLMDRKGFAKLILNLVVLSIYT